MVGHFVSQNLAIFCVKRSWNGLHFSCTFQYCIWSINERYHFNLKVLEDAWNTTVHITEDRWLCTDATKRLLPLLPSKSWKENKHEPIYMPFSPYFFPSEPFISRFLYWETVFSFSFAINFKKSEKADTTVKTFIVNRVDWRFSKWNKICDDKLKVQ